MLFPFMWWCVIAKSVGGNDKHIYHFLNFFPSSDHLLTESLSVTHSSICFLSKDILGISFAYPLPKTHLGSSAQISHDSCSISPPLCARMILITQNKIKLLKKVVFFLKFIPAECILIITEFLSIDQVSGIVLNTLNVQFPCILPINYDVVVYAFPVHRWANQGLACHLPKVIQTQS